MWIRSQDKLLLTNVDTSNGIMINEYPDECLISLEYANTSFKLGEYSSKEKALNMLDYIEDSLEYPHKEEQGSHSEDVAQAKKEINDLAEKIDQYKKYILELNCRFLDVENYSLEHYLDIDSFNYGMNYKDDLLNLGFTKQEMDAFILDRYEELVKEKEEDEDD